MYNGAASKKRNLDIEVGEAKLYEIVIKIRNFPLCPCSGFIKTICSVGNSQSKLKSNHFVLRTGGS